MHVQQHLHNAAMPKETKHLIFFALSYMYGMYFFKYKNYIMQSFVVVRGWKYFTLSLKTLDLNVNKGINRLWNYYAYAKQYFIVVYTGRCKIWGLSEISACNLFNKFNVGDFKFFTINVKV